MAMSEPQMLLEMEQHRTLRKRMIENQDNIDSPAYSLLLDSLSNADLSNLAEDIMKNTLRFFSSYAHYRKAREYSDIQLDIFMLLTNHLSERCDQLRANVTQENRVGAKEGLYYYLSSYLVQDLHANGEIIEALEEATVIPHLKYYVLSPLVEQRLNTRERTNQFQHKR